MNAFLDIGFTLLGGPKLSPPKMIASILELDDSRRDELSELVFTRNHTKPLSLIEDLEDFTSAKIDGDRRRRIVDFWDRQYEEVYTLDYALEFVAGLIESGVNVHIVSNLWFPFYDRFAQIFAESMPYFKSETLSFREGVRKPDPRFYEIALKKSGADPARSFSVGDSLGNDIVPYAEMGMRCIWYPSRTLTDEKMARAEKILSRHPNIYTANDLKQALGMIMQEISQQEEKEQNLGKRT